MDDHGVHGEMKVYFHVKMISDICLIFFVFERTMLLLLSPLPLKLTPKKRTFQNILSHILIKNMGLRGIALLGAIFEPT